MHTLLNGVTTTTTSATRNVNGVNTITCKGLKDYKQFIYFYISIDNVHFVLFKTITSNEETFTFNCGASHIYCKFVTSIENSNPVFVHLT